MADSTEVPTPAGHLRAAAQAEATQVAETEATPEIPEIVDRQVTAEGEELLLCRAGDGEWSIRVDGKVTVASGARRSEQSLVELAMAPLAQRDDVTVLLAGLGMGYALRRLLDAPGVVRVDVVELYAPIVEWNRRQLAAESRGALDDPRVHVHVGDLMSTLKRFRSEPLPEVTGGWLALILDVDDGPHAVSRPSNANIYSAEGLERLESALRPGGVLAAWSSERDVELLQRIHARYVNVAQLAVPVELGGKPSLDYVYRGRRAPRPPGPGSKMARA